MNLDTFNLVRKMNRPQVLYEKLRASGIPQHMHEGLVAYLTEGRPTGHFLHALLSNDFVGACNRADLENQHALFSYFRFLCSYAPAVSWGSPERVNDWLDLGTQQRLKERETAQPASEEV